MVYSILTNDLLWRKSLINKFVIFGSWVKLPTNQFFLITMKRGACILHIFSLYFLFFLIIINYYNFKKVYKYFFYITMKLFNYKIDLWLCLLCIWCRACKMRYIYICIIRQVYSCEYFLFDQLPLTNCSNELDYAIEYNILLIISYIVS